MNLLKKLFRKKKPIRWFTSDWHFGHKNVIDYCNRPYRNDDGTPSLDKMHPALREIWNSAVDPEDEVFVIGDWSLSPKWSGMISELNGTKHLIWGNHDAVFPRKLGQTDDKTQKMRGRYYRDGWKTLQAQLKMHLKDGTAVTLCHFPYDTEFDARYKEYRPKDEGGILIHGHLHSKYRKKDRQIDVGLDGDMKLWSEDEIIALIKDPRDFIETPLSKAYSSLPHVEI